MARIEKRVRSLVSNDPEMQSAVETVLARSEDGDIRWVDVKGDLTSGQWGRLIEQGVLVDGDSGFKLADEQATRAALNGDGGATASTSTTSSPSLDDADFEDSSWSIWDKGAAVVALVLFAGYSYHPIRSFIAGVFNVVLGPVNNVLPFYAVVMVLALVTALYSSLLQANLMDTEKVGAYQARMKDIQERQKQARKEGNDAELEKIQDEQMDAMGDQLGMMKENFRPMVWIMFLTIPVFLWMYHTVGIGQSGEFGMVTVPLAGHVHWKEPILYTVQTWLIWYFVCSMAFTQIIRKSLKIDMTPSAS